ncbi:MAG: glycoside hydrolase family 65 protein [Steroidobacteraceae bacterium]
MKRSARILAIAATVLAAQTTPARAAVDPGFVLNADATDLNQYFPAYLANGYVSTLSAPRGTEGTPAYMAGYMDYAAGDISRPALVPGWSEIDFSTGRTITGQSWLNKAPLRSDRFGDYRQTLDMRDALLETSYQYREGTKQSALRIRTFVSQAAAHLAATELSITPDFSGPIELSFALNLWAPHVPRLPLAKLSGPEMEERVAAYGLKLEAVPPSTPDRAALWYGGDTRIHVAAGDGARLTLWLEGRAEAGAEMAEAAAIALPEGMKPLSASVYRSPYRLALNLRVQVERGRTYTFAKFVALSHAGWGGGLDADRALVREARSSGFEHLLAAHRAAWDKLWQSDIVIDGDARAQQLAHSELYYLLASTTPDTAWSVGACGLTPGYAGHVFWDADTWIFPALLLLHPERARSMVMFRDRTLAAARQRAVAHDFQGAMYPWEADPGNGSEQTPHFAYVLGDREIHVNAAVAIAQWQYYLATRDRDWLRQHGWPVIRDIARFWTSRVHYDAQRNRYEILHVTSVREEFSDIPNDTYTNLAAAKSLRIATQAARELGEPADARWTRIADLLYVPMDGHGEHHLDFDPSVLEKNASWNGSSLQMLVLPSLDVPMSMPLRQSDYRYAMRPPDAASTGGNSMGLAPASIFAATVGNSADADAWFEGNSSGGTIKPPFNVRTETSTNNTGYFLTAAGGLVQNLVFGFTGLRIGERDLIEAYPPILPEGWKSLTLQNLAFQGQRFSIRVSRDADGAVQLARMP